MKISKFHSLLATLFVGLASMLLASCGSDDDDEPSGPATNPAYDNPALYKGTTTINEVDGAFEQAEGSQTTDITYTVDFNLSTNTLTVTCNNFKIPGFNSMQAMIVQFPDKQAIYDDDNITLSTAAIKATSGGRPASEMVTITGFEGSGKVGSGATLSVQYRCAVKGSVNKTFMVRASQLLP